MGEEQLELFESASGLMLRLAYEREMQRAREILGEEPEEPRRPVPLDVFELDLVDVDASQERRRG